MPASSTTFATEALTEKSTAATVTKTYPRWRWPVPMATTLALSLDGDVFVSVLGPSSSV
jgi:hypothetical protein